MGVSHSAYGGGRNLFGLAPGGVYQATPIAQGTGELLPRLFTLTLWNGAYAYSTGRYISVALSLPRNPVLSEFRSSPRYGPPCPAELGLSSPPDFLLRTNSEGATICFPSTPLLS